MVLVLSALVALFLGRRTGEQVRKASKTAEKANQDLKQAERHHEESNKTLEAAREDREERESKPSSVADRIARINERMRQHSSD